MNHKVLLADDSLTIQKVIKITLANQPYDITDCSNEDELFARLGQVQPKIVFLDFNLSEKFTGYELTAKIKSALPTTKVLLLLGTFDTIDDAAFEKCGASEKIVKPFDSNRFIAICKQLIETSAEDISYPAEESAEPDENVSASPEDQWTISHSTAHSKTEEIKNKPLDNSIPNLNALNQELSDWGMSVPDVIGSKQDNVMAFPPVIGDKKAAPAPAATTAKKSPELPKTDALFPANEDLDYPDFGNNAKEESEAPAKSKLIPIESFNVDPDSTGEFQLETGYAPEETDVKNIENQIRDEVEENLWQADEFEDFKKQVSDKIEEMKSGFQPTRDDFDESLFKPIDDSSSITWAELESTASSAQPLTQHQQPVNTDELLQVLRSEMEELVKKHVRQYMDEMFQKNVEKVSWEVIPDLAENLIRQEISRISDRILNDPSGKS